MLLALCVGAAHAAAPPHREPKKGQLMTLTPAQTASLAHWEQRTMDRRLLPEVKPIIPFGSSGGRGGADDPNAATTIPPHLLPFGPSYHADGDGQSLVSAAGQQGAGTPPPPPPAPPACAKWCNGKVHLKRHMQSTEDNTSSRTAFPTDDVADWAEKCSWDRHCGGCEQCANTTTVVTCDDFCSVRRMRIRRARARARTRLRCLSPSHIRPPLPSAPTLPPPGQPPSHLSNTIPTHALARRMSHDACIT